MIQASQEREEAAAALTAESLHTQLPPLMAGSRGLREGEETQ